MLIVIVLYLIWMSVLGGARDLHREEGACRLPVGDAVCWMRERGIRGGVGGVHGRVGVRALHRLLCRYLLYRIAVLCAKHPAEIAHSLRVGLWLRRNINRLIQEGIELIRLLMRHLLLLRNCGELLLGELFVIEVRVRRYLGELVGESAASRREPTCIIVSLVLIPTNVNITILIIPLEIFLNIAINNSAAYI